jgi:hypothetical protein
VGIEIDVGIGLALYLTEENSFPKQSKVKRMDDWMGSNIPDHVKHI